MAQPIIENVEDILAAMTNLTHEKRPKDILEDAPNDIQLTFKEILRPWQLIPLTFPVNIQRRIRL